jgi:hypothetical protein
VSPRTCWRWRTQSRGFIGQASITATSAVFTTLADIAGLSVTFTAVANRRYKISASGFIASTVANDTGRLSITDGANAQQQAGNVPLPVANTGYAMGFFVVVTPSAGSVTYKIRGERQAGTGNLTISAGATLPATILIEDIGPNGVPA